ncbi:MAG: hydroxyethylthiazole kinase, partial [bacterium]|nr:hydroxyethylthiazole kinase [bacterium]
FVTDGTDWVKIHNGHPMMRAVTGTGCGATTAAACFAACSSSLLFSVAAGIAVYNIAGQNAIENCKGPGSFVPEFIDQLANLSLVSIETGLMIESSL